MCNISGVTFGAVNLQREDIQGKRVLEVGSYAVNGSMRQIMTSYGPSEYVGVDIEAGPGVDRVCGAEDIIREFGKESFDVVLSTEMLEHVRNWRLVISNLKNIVKPGGILLVTTRSKGFHFHAYPYDLWRYEVEDMEKIFDDFEMLTLEADPSAPGVFFKARKPKGFKESDISNFKLYSMVTNCRVKKVEGLDLDSLHFTRLCMRKKMSDFIYSIGDCISKR